MSLYEEKQVSGTIVLYQREQVIGSRWKRGIVLMQFRELGDHVRQRNNSYQTQH